MIKRLICSAMLLVLLLAMPVSAKNLTEENVSIHNVKEFDLVSHTIKERTYQIDNAFTDTSSLFSNAVPFFLEPIDYAEGYPFSAIGKLSITYENGKKGAGTAFVVADNLVLTSAHCVYDYYNGNGAATKMHFQAGYNQDGSFIATSEASTFYCSSGWTELQDYAYDWALVKLKNPMGSATGIIPCKVISSPVGTTVMVSGYGNSEEYDGRVQLISEGTVTSASNGKLVFNADSLGGMSGSPVMSLDDPNLAAIGILSGTTVSGNTSGPCMNTVITNLIRNYQ
ncbi:MAG: trypsin-like serine protease [Clostridiales bacterium]|nr:trypsin-like serine protease [Clostridiales bacterium]